MTQISWQTTVAHQPTEDTETQATKRRPRNAGHEAQAHEAQAEAQATEVQASAGTAGTATGGRGVWDVSCAG